MDRYRLTMSKKQADIIVEALDFYSRMHCGQVSEITRLFRNKVISGKINRSVLDAACKVVKAIAFPEVHLEVDYGITSPEAPEESKIAYDVLQVIRNVMAWAERPDGGIEVSFDDPLQTSEEDLAEVDVRRIT